MSPGNQKIPLEVAKQVLRDRGYSYRQAAPLLGVCYQHLSEVLNGHRPSGRVLRKISALPAREKTPRSSTPRAS